MRFRRRNPSQAEIADFTVLVRHLSERHAQAPLVDGEIQLRNGLILRVDLSGECASNTVGYRAQKLTGVIDMDEIGKYNPGEFWEMVHVRDHKKLILDPNH